MIQLQIKSVISIAITSVIFISVPVFGGRHGILSPLIISPNSSSLRYRRSLKMAEISSPKSIYAVSFMSSSRSSRRSESELKKRGSYRNKEVTTEKKEKINLDEEVSYNDLGPIGKTVAGCTEIIFATVFEYCSGFMQGIMFGTLVSIPGFLFRPMQSGVRQAFKVEMMSRFTRMNTRSISWAKNFGSISAAFGGMNVAVKVLRNGEEDAWTQILSSAAAGAFFARKEGPQAMLRGALMYGGLIYVMSGNNGLGKVQEVEYTEKRAIERF